MKPRPIRTKADLISLIAGRAPTRACERALREGRHTVLGGFKPPGGFPCWIVDVESRFGKHWYVAVEADESAYELRVRFLEDVPWEHWIGRSDGRRPLIDGDMPTQAAFKRMERQRGRSDQAQ